MSRLVRLLLPCLALIAGLMTLPSTGAARQASPAWSLYGPSYGVVPGYYETRTYTPRRTAPRKAKRPPGYRQRSDRQPAYGYVRRDHYEPGYRANRVAAPRKATRQTAAARSARFNRAAYPQEAYRREAYRHQAYRYERNVEAPDFEPRRPRAAPRALPRFASLGDVGTRRYLSESVGRVEARIDVGAQRMIVKVDGEVRHVWKVSTGRSGFATPRGVYGPQRMHVSYFSKKYYNSPMPYSIFFRGGYAIHGTNEIGRLGGPASHGCVRLSVGNARTLFHLVKASGPGRARIVIS